MKAGSWLWLPTLIITLIIPLSTPAQYSQSPIAKSDFNGELNIDFASQYIWRGLEYNPKTVFQPSLRLNEHGFEIAVLGNYDITDANGHEGQFTEAIYRIGMAQHALGSDFSLTYNYYSYPKNNPVTGDAKTQEIALETKWGDPTYAGLNIYWDIDRADGFYLQSLVGFTWRTGPLSVTPQLALAFATGNYQYHYFNRHENTFVDFEASIEVELEVCKGVYLTAEGLYYELMKSGLREAHEATERGENFWAEGGLSFRF